MKTAYLMLVMTLIALIGCKSSETSGSGNGTSDSGTVAATHKVTYSGNTHTGGTAPTDNSSYAQAATVTVLNNTGTLVKTGQTFRGWNTQPNGSGTTRSPGETFSIGSTDIALYARWGTPVSVTYHGNGNTGGSAPTDAGTYATGASANILGNAGSLTKTGATFILWNTASNGSGVNLMPAASYTVPAENPTLYASWLQDFTTQTSAEGSTWRLCYGNGLFVAVGENGTNRIKTSPDGITWTTRTAPALNLWRSVAYGNGVFVAVSEDGTNRVMTSSDGATWTLRNAAEANSWYSVTFGNNQFVAVGLDGTNRVMTSADGVNWTARSAPNGMWNAVTYGKGLYVAVSFTGTDRVMTSPDGITWTVRTAAAALGWQAVAYGNDTFVAVALGGANPVMSSTDGITWTTRTSPTRQWLRVAYGNGLFIAVADDATASVISSSDGISWTTRTTPSNNILAVAYGGGVFSLLQNTGAMRAVWQ